MKYLGSTTPSIPPELPSTTPSPLINTKASPSIQFLFLTTFLVVFIGCCFATLICYVLRKILFNFISDVLQSSLGTHTNISTQTSRGTPATTNESSLPIVNPKSDGNPKGVNTISSLPCYNLPLEEVHHQQCPACKKGIIMNHFPEGDDTAWEKRAYVQIDQIDEAGRRDTHLIPLPADQLARLQCVNSSTEEEDGQKNKSLEGDLVEKVKLGQFYCVVCGNRYCIFSLIKKAKAGGELELYVDYSSESKVQDGKPLSEDGYETVSAAEKEER